MNHHIKYSQLLTGCLTGCILLLAGCKSIGPKMLPQDRMAYNKSISDSWREQTLLNIVKLRYLDTPLFIEVASVVSGYTLERSVNVSGQLSSPTAIQGDSMGLGAGGRMTDRPTITYAPVIGERFNRQLMTPIAPDRILFLMQSGWPAHLVMNVTVDSINGLLSPLSGGLNARLGDPEFPLVVDLIREAQLSNAIGMRIKESDDQKRTTMLIMHRGGKTPEMENNFSAICELLELDPTASEFEISYGFIQQNNTELVIRSRSILQIMIEMAGHTHIPAAHEAAGICASRIDTPKDNGFVIHSSQEEPDTSAVKVFYRDYWYYISDSDLDSKRIFGFMMLLFSLTESGENTGLPLVTIPAQ